MKTLSKKAPYKFDSWYNFIAWNTDNILDKNYLTQTNMLLLGF